MLQQFLPESLYTVDSEMNRKKLAIFYDNNYTITGKITRFSTDEKLFEVSLGGDIMAFMPLTEATIYPIYQEDGRYAPSIYTLLGKTIRAKVKVFDGSYYIILSRKDNMLEALEVLKNETKTVSAVITGFSRSSAFMDIGSGIIGRSFTRDYAGTIFRNAKDVGIKHGELVPVKLKAFQNDINKFDLSRVDAMPNIEDTLSVGDKISCKVFDSIGDGEGYYVLIKNSYCGILDSPNHELNYGDKVLAIIHKITPKGPRLDLVKKL